MIHKTFLAIVLSFGILLTSCVQKSYFPIKEELSTPWDLVSRAPTKNRFQTLVSVRPPLQKPLKKETIVIDAGHGGEDFGAHSLTTPKYQEKYLNMATALFLKDYLQQMGYRTILTRTQDVFIPLSNRAIFANNLNTDLFVSIHYNSAPSRQAEGIEVYYYKSKEDESRTKHSRLLAENVLNQVVQKTEAKSRGVKHGDFAVIRETKMPAILIEGGFLTNDQEMQKIKDPAYLKRLAWGMAEGINHFLVNTVKNGS